MSLADATQIAFTSARVAAFLAGLWLVFWTLGSAVRAFVLPRSDRVALQRFVFRTIFLWYKLRTRKVKTYEDRDRVMAMYAPVALLAMPAVVMALVLVGYTSMFWALTIPPLQEAIILSGSSLFTLGFRLETGPAQIVLIYTEATIGLGLVALLISYLPTMYSAFSQRERSVAMLEVRAGDPPTAVELLKRFNRLERIDALDEFFADWEIWFANLEETHTSLVALVFFRSPQPERSWITAAGAVLDSAALYNACVADVQSGYRGALCIRAGYIALRRIADFFDIAYDPAPVPGDPITIDRWEFEEAYKELMQAGVPMKADVDQAWRDFAGWRVNYDRVLVALAALIMAPYAPWSSDRSVASMPSVPARTAVTQPSRR